jgi:hypothetical protein
MLHAVCEAPRPQGGASRKGNFIHIVPLHPAEKAGLAGHVPVKIDRWMKRWYFLLSSVESFGRELPIDRVMS